MGRKPKDKPDDPVWKCIECGETGRGANAKWVHLRDIHGYKYGYHNVGQIRGRGKLNARMKKKWMGP